VTRLLARLLVVVAVLLMPLGMATGAPPAHEAHGATGMAMEHCPDQAPKPDAKGALAGCTMACSSALPAAEMVPAIAWPIHLASVHPAPIASLQGIDPDTATPPPKRS